MKLLGSMKHLEDEASTSGKRKAKWTCTVLLYYDTLLIGYSQ
jgi:hypothetical protein